MLPASWTTHHPLPILLLFFDEQIIIQHMISHEASFDHSKDFTLLIFRGCVSKNSNIGSVKRVYIFAISYITLLYYHYYQDNV